MIEIKLAGPVIQVSVPYQLRELARVIGNYKWNPDQKVWEFSATKAMAQRISAVLAPYDLTATDDFWNLENRNVEELRKVKTATHNELEPIPLTKLDPWIHQLRAYNFAKDLTACALFLSTFRVFYPFWPPHFLIFSILLLIACILSTDS